MAALIHTNLSSFSQETYERRKIPKEGINPIDPFANCFLGQLSPVRNGRSCSLVVLAPFLKGRVRFCTRARRRVFTLGEHMSRGSNEKGSVSSSTERFPRADRFNRFTPGSDTQVSGRGWGLKRWSVAFKMATKWKGSGSRARERRSLLLRRDIGSTNFNDTLIRDLSRSLLFNGSENAY